MLTSVGLLQGPDLKHVIVAIGGVVQTAPAAPDAPSAYFADDYGPADYVTTSA